VPGRNLKINEPFGLAHDGQNVPTLTTLLATAGGVEGPKEGKPTTTLFTLLANLVTFGRSRSSHTEYHSMYYKHQSNYQCDHAIV
jgi:hypothetical protein